MKKYMKSSRIKKIVIKCADFWMDEHEVDSEIFDDVYAEAATRAVEKRKDVEGFKLTPVLECWEKKDFKKPNKHFCYNSYRILINAGLHGKAEMMRFNFLKIHGIDLQVESLKGEEDNGKPDIIKQSSSGSLGE